MLAGSRCTKLQEMLRMESDRCRDAHKVIAPSPTLRDSALQMLTTGNRAMEYSQASASATAA
jgi:hypothetical protein